MAPEHEAPLLLVDICYGVLCWLLPSLVVAFPVLHAWSSQGPHPPILLAFPSSSQGLFLKGPKQDRKSH